MSRVIAVLLLALICWAPPGACIAEAAPARTAAAGPVDRGSVHAPVILVFGDSISAAHGIHVEQGWVALLAQKIRQEGYGFRVVNASISGETTSGGLARLPRALALHRPRILVLELGGNDGLRGLPLSLMRRDLDRMITLAQRRGIRVLLLGMRLPPNYGVRYTHEFHQIYLQLAAARHVALVPFLLDHVALRPGMMQADGLHPTARGQPLLLADVWPKLVPLMRAVARRRAG